MRRDKRDLPEQIINIISIFSIHFTIHREFFYFLRYTRAKPPPSSSERGCQPQYGISRWMSKYGRMKAQRTSLYFFLYLFLLLMFMVFCLMMFLSWTSNREKVFWWVASSLKYSDLLLLVFLVCIDHQPPTIRHIPSSHPLSIIRGDEWRTYRDFFYYTN